MVASFFHFTARCCAWEKRCFLHFMIFLGGFTRQKVD